MASIIKVDQIQTAAGGTPTAADLGINNSGNVLQIVTDTIGTSEETQTSTTGSWVGTNLIASITPSSTSSKIMAVVNSNMKTSNGSTFTCAMSALQRSIGGGAYSLVFDYTKTDGGGNVYQGSWLYNYGGCTELAGSVGIHYLDSPNTTSAVTYNVVCRALGGYGTMYYNSGSSITLLEIAG